ncbi:hypothetical protein G1H11_02155 [Phytoactinopolyspora alkaliphila]|uniref:Nuclear transport factor 2 family protein n=1 Tax=Phytoactinopolyspora alkaliphila TaxID=1783498 RepID=A0A6N9YGP8_9ACTN|nr:hypothetical protein [Phytoactinopolyspora alkaliphila]NED94107.1 hypothetical protein [Phytoactinopolyspora alkaliphila]
MNSHRRLTRLGILTGLVAFFAAGCGSDEDRAISAAEDFFGALADVDAARACELNLGSDGNPLDNDHVDWQACVTGVETWANSVAIPVDSELPTVSFESVEITGETAHVSETVPAEYGFAYAYDLRLVDGSWYVDGAWYL